MFVPTLLSHVKRRPADGPVVKQSLDWWHRCEGTVRPASAVVVALLLITFLFTACIWTLQQRNHYALQALQDQQVAAKGLLQAEEDRSSRVATEKESLRGQLAEAQTEQAALQKQLDEVVSKSPNPTPPKPVPIPDAQIVKNCGRRSCVANRSRSTMPF